MAMTTPRSWWQNGGGAPFILTYQFAVAVAVTGYIVTGYTSGYGPKNWKIQGSNNGTDWTDLDTRAGESVDDQNTQHRYDFTNTTAYTYCRINVSAAINDGGTCIITMFQFVGSLSAADYPDRENVAPDDTVNGLAGTMDLPALSSIDPADTLRGSTGTLDLPALNKVAPSDTLKGSAGTMDLPSLSNVLPSDTLEGAQGTSDKLYSVADEAARNTVADLTKIPTPATGGPSTFKQLNVDRTGTLDLDAVKAAYEAARNNTNGTIAADILSPHTVTIRNVTITGTATEGGGMTPEELAAWEAARNTDPGAANVLAESEGGPANYLIRGASKTPAYIPSGQTLRDFPVATEVGTSVPEIALRSIALANGTVAGLLADRIFPSEASLSAAYPLALTTLISSDYAEDMDGADDEEVGAATVQFDVFAITYAKAKEVAKALRIALNGFSCVVTINGVSHTIRRIRLTNENDEIDKPRDGKSEGIFRVIQEYEIWYL